MIVKAIINFNDLESNKHRAIGDTFECSKERAEYLLSKEAVEIVEMPKLKEVPKIENVEETIEKIKDSAKEEVKKSKKKTSKKK